MEDSQLQLLQLLDSDGLDGTGHTSVLHMATVSFAPAGKLALVEGVFSPCAGHIVHPDQTSTCTQKTRVSGGFRTFTLRHEDILPNLTKVNCLLATCSPVAVQQ